jgi:peptidoglycan hydrolase-like protein with peptidoglycan-binding domain
MSFVKNVCLAAFVALGLLQTPVDALAKTAPAKKVVAKATTKATAKQAATKAVAAKKPTVVKASAKKKSSKKSKKPAPTRYAQQHPTTERYVEIQRALVERGYLHDATGVWGDESTTALRTFQQDQGLRADGKLSALALTAMGLGPRRTPGVDVLGSTPLD